MRELRCQGLRSSGARCGALLARVNCEGDVEIKCYRGGCKHLNLFRVTARAKAER